MTDKKKSGVSREQKRIRTQQLIFGVVAVILILSWIISMINPF